MKASEYIPNYDSIKIGEFYKDGFFWRKKSVDGSDGKGDLIFNTCYKIYRDNDKSDWAFHAMVECATLLLLRKRWPDRMSDNTDADSYVERIVNMLWMRFGLAEKLPYRYQGRMSRDPWIALYTVAVFLDRKQFIEAIKIPWYLYSHNTWRWRRRLIKDNRDIAWRRLGWLRASAVVMDQSEFK